MKGFVEAFLGLVTGFVCGAMCYATVVHGDYVEKTEAERECWYQLGVIDGMNHQWKKTESWKQWQKQLERYEKTGTFEIAGKCYKAEDYGKIVECK